MNKQLKISYLLLLLPFWLLGQENLKTDTLIVVKPYKPTLVKADKLSTYPSIADTQKIDLDFNYQFVPRQFTSTYQVDSIQPAKIKGEPLIKLYRGYAILGFGNNTTPWGELYYNNLRSRKNNWGLHLKHFSSNGINSIEDSDFRHNNFDLYGKKITKKLLFDAGLNYTIHHFNYYGDYLNPSVSDQNAPLALQQEYNTLGGRLSIENLTTDSAKLNFKVGAAYYNLKDNYASTEDYINLATTLQTRLDNGLLGQLELEMDNNNYQSEINDSGLTASTSIVKIYPTLKAGNERWQFTGGPAFFLEAGDESRFALRAIGEFRLNLIDEVVVPYAGVKGGLVRNNYGSLTKSNPFVNSSLTLVNSDNTLEIFGGFRGSFSSKISFNASVANSQVNDQPFFIKSTYLDSRFRRSFNVIYDNLITTTIKGELTYGNLEKLNVFLSGAYFTYETDRLAEAWHMPEYKVNMTGIYDLRDKIILKLDLYFIGPQKAARLENLQAANGVNALVTQTETLDGIFDANLGLEYRYTKKVAAFINFNNIASVNYQRWQDYPIQRFNLIGGLKFSF